MSVPLWAAELADSFWALAGGAGPFPRDLRRPIARALTLPVVSLPRLRLDGVRGWLVRNGVACPCAEADRPLRGCLVAWRGCGFVFLDGADPDDEQRFSLAHELAHFLRDYWQPRRLACERLGPRVAEVFDGDRPPSAEERLSALLARVPVGHHVHLLSRDRRGRFATAAVAAAEDDADRLAFELLAPAGEVLAQGGDAAALAGRLQEEFGLPAAEARAYAALLQPVPAASPLLRRLGIVR